MVTSKSQPDKTSDDFVISNYTSFLEKVPGKGSYYKCPCCELPKLSISRDGVKYTCYNGCSGKHIAFKLRELSGEFKKKADNVDTSQSSLIIPAPFPSKDYYIDPLQVNNSDLDDKEDSHNVLKVQDIYPFYKEKLGDKLAYNLRTKEIELSGHPLDLDAVRIWTQQRYGVTVSNREYAIETLMFLAREREYDPVLRFIEKCYHGYEPSAKTIPNFEELTLVLFGVSAELYCEYLRRWLIGIVARVKFPGCKLDEALILQGSQGCNKSSFFKAIAGEYFSDSMGEPGRESLLIMSRNWINEWAEFDRMTAKSYHGDMKAFLSAQEDMYRLPYGRDVQRVPRASVLVGTTNRDNLLTDPTGNRRLWIIPVADGHTIPLDLVEEIRENLIGWAFTELMNDESWHLPKEFWKLQAEDNLQYERVCPWDEAIYNWLYDQPEVTTLECLAWLEKNGYPHKYSRSDEMVIGDILKRHKFKRSRTMRQGKQIYVYKHPSLAK